MRHKILHIAFGIVLLISFLVLENCAPQKKNVFSKIYHNTTAHYNAYFIALEQITEVEAVIEEAHDRDYDRVLMVFPDIDSATIDSNREKLNDCIKKASIAIQRHANSHWVDDSYLLIGKSWFYQGQFANAIETLKYVYTQSEDDDTRHSALVSLMRTYVHYNEHNNAVAVGDVLMKEGPNDDNLRDYYLTCAYMYQIRQDYDVMLKYVREAVRLEKNKKSRAKIHFILGQLYQRMGQQEEAYLHYRRSLKSNPDYELSFYAKLNLAQVTGLDSETDEKKVRNYFRKLLKDEKNEEYRDKIYYEMARFELKRENYEQAVTHLKASVRENQGNQRQKAYSYLQLAELYYDHYRDYTLAQAYYDSTVNVLPTDNDRYEEIAERQEVLSDFVQQINTIHDQDSLLQLAAMPEHQLQTLLEEVVATRERAREEQEKALRQQQRRNTLAGGQTDRNMSSAFGSDTDVQSQGSEWYFYNQAAVSNGMMAFRNRWGGRPLEDHWRRSTKESIAQFAVATTTADVADTTASGTDASTEGSAEDAVEALMATIPFSEEQQEAALASIEKAYYNLGKIYWNQLQEPQNAVETFEELIRRFPNSEYEPEVLYQLVLILNATDAPAAAKYKKRLLSKHPDTVYANLAQNPNYLQESRETSERLEELYRIAYRYYEQGDYEQSSMLVSRALDRYADNAFSDHLRLLDILITGKVEGRFQYQYALQQFIENNPESSLVGYANVLLEKSRNFVVDQAKRSGANFSERLDHPHLFVLLYKTGERATAELPGIMDRFITRYDPEGQLSVGNLVFNNVYSILLINKFEDREAAERFVEAFERQDPVSPVLGGDAATIFIITEDNFKLFYQTRLLDDYLSFYEKHYQ